jgi:hypothetical protein
MYVGALALGVVDQADGLPSIGDSRLEHDGELEIGWPPAVANEDPALGQTDRECTLAAQSEAAS